MSYFQQTDKEIKMQKDVIKIREKLNEIKRLRGKADLIKDCDSYLSKCSGWNPLLEEALIKRHKDILKKYKLLA